jgi:DNA polymerase elongation subunit (family B)
MLKAEIVLERPKWTLAFDMETLAAGYADPQWVPSKITCIAWKFLDSDYEPETEISDFEGFFLPSVRREMVQKFLNDYNQADAVVGHNLLRYDLPVLNAECLRLDLPPLKPILVYDSIRLVKTKGFKKGLDNMGELLKVPVHKQAMSWQEWEHAYEQHDWPLVRSRCASDVELQMEVFKRAQSRGWLKPPVLWKP